MDKAGLVVSALVLALSAAPTGAADDYKPETIIALERSALDRWGKAIRKGFLRLTPRTFPTSIRLRSTASMALRR